MNRFTDRLGKLLDLDLSQWHSWLILLAAVSVAGLVFLFGVEMLRRLGWMRGNKKMNPLNALLSDSEAKATPRHALLLHRGRRGLDLLVDDPQRPDAVLSIRTVQAPGSIPWVRITVVACKPAGKNFLLNCEYVDRPPWNVVVWFN